MCLMFFISQNVFEVHLYSGTCISQKPSDSDANGLSASYLVPPLALSPPPCPLSQGPCSLLRTPPAGTPLAPLCFHTAAPSSCVLICVLGLLSTPSAFGERAMWLVRSGLHSISMPLPSCTRFYSLTCSISLLRLPSCISTPTTEWVTSLCIPLAE